jgi:hypothetical protein
VAYRVPSGLSDPVRTLGCAACRVTFVLSRGGFGRRRAVAISAYRRRRSGLIGAELSGLDLTREYPDQTYQAILRAWAEHGVIFLRDQHLDAEQRDVFASKLGEIRVRQELRKDPAQTKAIGEGRLRKPRIHWNS